MPNMRKQTKDEELTSWKRYAYLMHKKYAELRFVMREEGHSELSLASEWVKLTDAEKYSADHDESFKLVPMDEKSTQE